MTSYQFQQLNKNDQAEYVWAKGEHIGTRFYPPHAISLWRLEQFCVEIFYHKKENRIEKIRSFVSSEPLFSYLNDFKIDTIFG